MNEKNQKCIICAIEKSGKDFNTEHIILESLGGKRFSENTLNDVCVGCNSKLGMHVDSRFVNSPLLEFIRNRKGIKGRNGVPGLEKLDIPFWIPEIIGNLVTDSNTGDITGFRAKYGKSKNFIFAPKNVNLGYFKNHVKSCSDEEIKTRIIDFDNVPLFPRIDNISLPHEAVEGYLKYAFFPLSLKISFEYAYKYLGEQWLNQTISKDIQKVLVQLCQGNTLIKVPTDTNLYMGDKPSNEIMVEFEGEGDKIYVRIDIFGIFNSKMLIGYKNSLTNLGSEYPKLKIDVSSSNVKDVKVIYL